MSNAAYFVRSRGKISGPFDIPALQKLIRRGTLSRMHEISPDRQTWIDAGQFDQLFPTQSANAGGQSSAEGATGQHGSRPQLDPVGMGVYYYVQNGATVGPVPAAVLQSLAQNGTLRANDLAWIDGAQAATPAGQLPILVPIFSGPMAGVGTAIGSRPLSDAERAQCQQVLNSSRTLAMVSGVVIGVLLLLFLNLPVGQINGKTLWWWDTLKAPLNGTVAVILFYVLFAGLCVGVMGVVTRGLVRAWSFIGISGLSFLLFLVVGLSSVATDGGYFFSLIIPYLATALVGISYFRARAPRVNIGAVFQGVFGGALAFFTLIVAIVGLAQQTHRQAQLMLNSEQLPGWLVIALVIAALGIVAAMTAGILGLVSLKPKFSNAVNRTCVVCAGLGVLLPSIAFMIAVCGFVNAFQIDQRGQAIFLWFRGIAIFLALIALMAVGVMELFTVAHFRPLLDANRSQ